MAGNEADVVRDEAMRGLDGSNREAGLRRRETIILIQFLESTGKVILISITFWCEDSQSLLRTKLATGFEDKFLKVYP